MNGAPMDVLLPLEETVVELTFEVHDPPKRLRCVVALTDAGVTRMRLSQPVLFDADRRCVYAASTYLPAGTIPPGSYEATAVILEVGHAERRALGRTIFRFEVLDDEDASNRETGFRRKPPLPWDVVPIASLDEDQRSRRS
jgi:hypothetical protein